MNAIKLDELHLKLEQYIPENLREHCTIGNFNKGCLLLMVDKPEWATELRYSLPELRDNLRQKAGLYNLTSIKIEVAKKNVEQATPHSQLVKPQELSSNAKAALINASELCSYPPLKSSLLHLARDGE